MERDPKAEAEALRVDDVLRVIVTLPHVVVVAVALVSGFVAVCAKELDTAEEAVPTALQLTVPLPAPLTVLLGVPTHVLDLCAVADTA